MSTLPPEPTSSGANLAPVKSKVEERPHPLTPLAKSWMLQAVLLFSLVRNGRDLLHFFTEANAAALKKPILWILIFFSSIIVVSLISGYISWRFTRFIIDDEELRIERRFIYHRSDKIQFERIQSVDIIQPLLARLIGLAALRIDVGGSHQSKTIEFLSKARANQLRDNLLAHAPGPIPTLKQALPLESEQTLTTEQLSALEQASALNSSPAPEPPPTLEQPTEQSLGETLIKNAREEQVIIKVGPLRLIIATLLSTEFIFSIIFFGLPPVFTFLALLTTSILSSATAALPTLIPFALIIGQLIWSRVINDWNFTLTRTLLGVRITKGLASVTSQSLPLNRIQAVQISQSLLWRPLGLYRVQVNVLGYSIQDTDADKPSSLVLPIGKTADVQAILRLIWPAFDPVAIKMQGVPRRVRWLHPFTAHTLRWGLDEKMSVTAGGLAIHRTTIVPHAKIQSTQLLQGPLQKRLNLASVAFHLPVGGAFIQSKNSSLDLADARWLALTTSQRARLAREAEQNSTWLDAMPTPSTP